MIDDRVRDKTPLHMIFLPDAPIFQFMSALLMIVIIRIVINRSTKQNKVVPGTIKTYLGYFGISFLLYLVLSNLLGLAVSFLFNTIARNFNQYTLLTNNISRAVDFTLFGSIYLVYQYAAENQQYKKQLNHFDKALASSKIQQLKAQLNPHFLFNNLNTLDELIFEADKEKASDFLQQFADLYRYALKTSTLKLVPLMDEVQFAKSYFHMVEQKYTGYYRLHIQKEQTESLAFVPPFCLQLLIENAITHNLGTSEAPVTIHLQIEANAVEVRNNRRPKSQHSAGNGVALDNLKKQFSLLGKTPLQIQQTNTHFTVRLPLITDKKHVSDTNN